MEIHENGVKVMEAEPEQGGPARGIERGSEDLNFTDIWRDCWCYFDVFIP